MALTTEDLTARGYRTWGGEDPFEDMIAPFYFNEEGEDIKCAFISERKHCNGHGMLHGGLLMTFADFAMFAIARRKLEDGMAVTAGFNAEFISAGPKDALIEATGEVVRATRSLLFVRGTIFTGDTTILTFSGILKRIKGK
ncbi:PaaI family thioesterase [Kordiimonas aestuarii]|uniref:PaaI family thioesterase n=1 Tax=Kordiimonas aestuarii TaxID=1005925 RepID=UPI0021CF1A07|nr:PaaI family thioesterase [Kordiimonas aestuarii]